MQIRKIFIFCLLWLALPVVAQEAAVDSIVAQCPIDTIQGRPMYRYTVERSVGLYRVSKNFGVSQDVIIEVNPELRTRGLRFGEVIYIPVPEEQSKKLASAEVITGKPMPTVCEQKPIQPRELPQRDTISRRLHDPRIGSPRLKEMPIDSLLPKTDSVAVDTIVDINKWNNSTALHLSILLPFQAKNTKLDQGAERFVEFYEGCLLAAYDLQAEGQPLVLDVYDTEKNTSIVRQLIDSNRLAGTQAVIGLAYPLQLMQVMPWAMEHQVPVLAPFIDYMEGIETNPYLYFFNSSVEQEARALGQWLEEHRESVNCVLVEAKDADIPPSIRMLRQEIHQRGISNTSLTVRQILCDSIRHALRDSMENIFVFNTEKYSNVQVLIPHLVSSKGNHQITLRAQYSWTRENIPMPLLYTSIFAAESTAERTEYELLYARYFGHKHVSEKPRYDLLGYDLTHAIVAILNDTTARGLQSDIHFEQIAPGGGFCNRNVQIIHQQKR